MKNKLERWRNSKREEIQRPFDIIRREMDNLFDSIQNKGNPFGKQETGFSRLELSETDEDIQVRAELPGVDEKDIHVQIEDDVLVLTAEHRKEKTKKKKTYYISEMSYGSYRQVVPLPAEVDSTNVEAKFKRGVLSIKLPKTESARSNRKQIPVQAG